LSFELLHKLKLWFVAEDEQFEADKAQVIKEISILEPEDP
jgi:hypothetical protein